MDPELRAQLDRIEQKLDLLLRVQGIATPEPSPPVQDHTQEYKQLLRRGQKIQAIKLYRERTGVGLREAKEAIEALEDGRQPW